MGNTFTIYTGNNHFDIVTNSDLYSFAIVGVPAQITFTARGDWVASSEGTSDSAYNYIFRYQPSGIRTAATFESPGSWVFTLNSGTIPSGLEVHWVNGTTASYDGNENSSTPYSGVTYNVEFSSSDAGSGGGDPHIIPLYNPLNKIWVLTTDNKTYKYFDNRDPNQRIVINSRMWVLDNRFIYITEKLQKMNSPYYQEAKNKVTNYIVDHNYNEIDTSFVKYISFMVKTPDHSEVLVFDTETLLPVDIPNVDLNHIDSIDMNNTLEKIDNYSLPNTRLDKSKYKYLQVSDIAPFKGKIVNIDKIISNESDTENFYREIKIDSKKHGTLIFNIIRLPDRINHRNHIEIRLKEPYKVNPYNCCGTLIKLDQIETVPSIFHINKDVKKVHINNLKLLDTRQWRRRRSQLIKTDRVRRKRYIKRFGKGEKDFYSLVNEDPEREYLRFQKK